jgi:hypothetical protein
MIRGMLAQKEQPPLRGATPLQEHGYELRAAVSHLRFYPDRCDEHRSRLQLRRQRLAYPKTIKPWRLTLPATFAGERTQTLSPIRRRRKADRLPYADTAHKNRQNVLT